MQFRKYLSSFFLILLFAASLTIAQPELVTVSLNKNNLTVTAGGDVKVILTAVIKIGWHINSHKPNDEFLIPTTIKSGNKSFPVSKINFPKPIDRKLAFSEAPVSVFEGESKFDIIFKVDKAIANGKYTIPIQFGYQGCNDETCMPPTEVVAKLEIEVSGGGDKSETLISNKDQEQDQNQDQEQEQESIVKQPTMEEIKSNQSNRQASQMVEENSIADTIEKSGLFLSLIFVFLGGLALNLTPCVYPLIPITIGYFGGQSEGRTSRLFLLGILYVLGMSLTYSVIGVVTSLSGAVFGTLLQNKFVIIGIAVLFIVLALSQFGVYEFKLPDSWVMKAGGAKGGAFGAFFMGLTMGIVAAPCIGPFVLGLVTYVAAKGDPFYGFLMFFILALGLGFPYLLLALFSGKIKKLPRAGDWMDGVKHVFGFLLLGMAFYFVDPILPKSIQGYSLPIFGVIAALILLFVDKKANNVKGFRIFKIVFSVLVLAVSIYALIPTEKRDPGWQKFSEGAYEESLKNNERMIVDFYADWCIPCKELDALTFSNAEVIKEMERFSKYKVDMTETLSDETEKLRNRFNIIGMPTVLIIDSKGTEVKRLTGFVNAEEFLKIIKPVE